MREGEKENRDFTSQCQGKISLPGVDVILHAGSA
jgi:hypothetical protein